MMRQPTGIRILKSTALTIGEGAKSQSVSRRVLKSTKLGEQKIQGGLSHIPQLQEQYAKEHWLDSLVSDVMSQKASPITRITTILLLSCGFATHATSKDIKS